MRVLDLFSGIGGFSLGLERAGMRTVGFCEIDSFCQAVLRKHWPDVPIWGDIRTLSRRERILSTQIDLICGGFPCQDISLAGKGVGIEGERSGLWSEYARIIGEVRPRYVIVENVAALLGRGLDRVLGDLATLGYDAEWHCIPASAVGAPHRRDRIWIIAYPGHGDEPERARPSRRQDRQRPAERGVIGRDGAPRDVAEAVGSGIVSHSFSGELRQQSGRRDGACGADPSEPTDDGEQEFVADANRCDEHGRGRVVQMGWGEIARQIADDDFRTGAQWSTEPDVGRVAHGVSNRVHRLRALGNAVVPQIPELIGRAIMRSVVADVV